MGLFSIQRKCCGTLNAVETELPKEDVTLMVFMG